MHTQSRTLSPAVGDPENPGGASHIPALDGIRGLAILLVLGVHLFTSNVEVATPALRIIGEILLSGSIGVNLFFVLSGYLITGILMGTLDTKHYFKTFYARRALRIFPLYYGSLLLLLLLTRPMHLHWGGWGPLLVTYTANLAFWRANQFVPVTPFNINHFWSLQVEEQFYFVWPWIVYRLRASAKIIKIALLGCATAFILRLFLIAFRSHYQNIYFPYTFTFSCVDNLLYGCCLAALMRTSARERVLRGAPYVFAVGGVLILAMGVHYGGLPWQTNDVIPTVGFSIIAVTWTAMIAMTLRPGSPAQSAFSAPVLRFFGRYSYGLYVFHYSIAEIVGMPVRLWMNLHFHSKALAVFSGAISALALSVALAVLSYHLYEAPFLRLKRNFSYRSEEVAT